MSMHHAGLAELVRSDPRYAYEAYEFVFDALEHTIGRLGRKSSDSGDVDEVELHVTAAELLNGARDLALREYGMMARIVFRMWGIRRTSDFGTLVYNLIDANLMNKNDSDRREDFDGVFDLERSLTEGFAIQFDEANL
jgi:uncharacterized repeat protein (TIGR04138 family)